MISKQEALEKFKEIIGDKESYRLLLQGQFIDHLSIFQSWALRQSLWEIERNLQEYFLSSALNRSSIVAHAQDREYIPRMATPATGKIQITNNGSAYVAIPALTAFQGNQLRYSLDDAIVVPAGDTVEDLSVSQTEEEIITSTVAEETAFLEILFDAEKTAQIHDISVYVDLGDGVGPELWTLARRFMNSDGDAHVYDTFYTFTEQFGIRFGNGTFGLKPPVDAVISAHLWLTSGDTVLLSGQRMQHIGTLLDNIGQSADLVTIVTQTIDGGAEPENTESIRQNAHYSPIYNDSLVWAEDFKFFIRRHFPNVIFLNVWGEQEQEVEAGHPDLDFINRIYISAYQEEADHVWRGAWAVGTEYAVDDVVFNAEGKWKCRIAHTAVDSPTAGYANWAPFQYPLELAIPSKLNELILLNKKITWVDPIYSTFSLAITGGLPRTKRVGEITAEIRNILEAAYGKDSQGRLDNSFKNDFYRLISETKHFTDTDAWFQIVASGAFEETSLAEFNVIDMDATTINLGYLS